MSVPILLLSLILGFIIGSFLNAVLYRYGTGRGLNGRSICFSCGKTLTAFELIPIVSFLVQKGTCKSCKARISWQYPLVEILTGVVFVLLVWQKGPIIGDLSFWSIASLLMYWVIASFLILIAVYDLHHKIIPDEWVIGLGLAGLVLPLFAGEGFGAIFFAVINRVLAGAVLGLFFWTIWHFSKGKAMGFGDVKLAVSIGIALGLMPGITAIVFAFWIGAVVGLLLILASRHHWLPKAIRSVNMKTEIPFAPFIVLGALISLLFNLNVWYF